MADRSSKKRPHNINRLGVIMDEAPSEQEPEPQPDLEPDKPVVLEPGRFGGLKGKTLAMAAEVADRVWTIEEIVGLLP